MTVLGFDVETVKGSIVTMQFATSVRDAVLLDATPDTGLELFLRFLHTHGSRGMLNLLWAHNLEFDFGATFTSIFDLLWKRPLKIGTLSAQLSNGVRVELNYHNTDNPFHQLRVADREWLFLDTSAFFKGSLAKVCAALELPVQKLPPPPYLGQRRPTATERPAFEAYALNDARAAYALGRYISDRHREFNIGPSFSMAHMASRIFQKHFLPTESRRAHRWVARDLPSDVVKQWKGRLRRRVLVPVDDRIPFCDGDSGPAGLLEASLLAYRGGKMGLYVPPGVYDDVVEVDIVSAYPHALISMPPLTAGRWERVTEVVPGAAAIYHIHGHVLGACPYGLFYSIGGGPLVRRGSFEAWVTGWELEEALPEIAVTQIERGYAWVPAPRATNPFAEYVHFFFAKKQTTPREDPRYATYKLLMNSLYGKLVQVVIRRRGPAFEEEAVGGALFNPFWAGQITGHCRAHLHRLEHRYHALHSSTDSIMTRANDVPTGTALGDLSEQGRGRWLVLRARLHFLVDNAGHVNKDALHAFREKTPRALLAWVLGGGGTYQVERMVRPREAARLGKTAFQMQTEQHRLRIDPLEVKRVADAWNTLQAARPIPFPVRGG